MKESNEQLYRLRHSLAHVLAQAVLELRPTAKLAFGPPVDNGCYYDFLFEEPIRDEDFPDIEKRMRKIIAARHPFVRTECSCLDAASHLNSLGQLFKAEYCQELGEKGAENISFYTCGSFEDMCEGPHLTHTGEIPPDCFKLDSIAGAYWRGDEKKPQLSRIYCLAFSNRQELDTYIKNRELARERDHRKLGKELELFVFSDLVGPGLPLWTPNGTAIRESLEEYAKEVETRYGYVRVVTPHIAKEEMYLTSGHLPYYKDSMFPPMKIEGECDYYLKAMNCPHHFQLYSYRPRSFRELPLRMAEYGTVYRFESSGTLAGLLRVRGLTQNDAHIFCTEEQLREELKSTVKMTTDYFNLFRFQGIQARYSTHDPLRKEKFVDNPKLWEFSEQVVKEVLDEMLPGAYELGAGEAAFYGPKIDFQARTLLGREESISTTQLDFSNPIRFDLKYVSSDGKEHQAFVVHRAPLGTHERFIAFLIEHFGGAFPTWLAPVQVRVVPVGEIAFAYAKEIESLLKNSLVRVDVDLSDNSFNKKIREAVVHKIPNIAVIGAKEAENRTVTLRRYCVKEQTNMSLDNFVSHTLRMIKTRRMDNFPDVSLS